jgi:predicted Zn finger-like uncharacterized protein
MILKLACPECDTRFSIPEATLGSEGRTVRCSRCTHKWFATPELPKNRLKPKASPRQTRPPEVKKKATPLPPQEDRMRTPDINDDEKIEQFQEIDREIIDPPHKDDEVSPLREPHFDNSLNHLSDLMNKAEPETMPGLFLSDSHYSVQKSNRGGLLLWFLGITALVLVLGTIFYFVQERLSYKFPVLGTVAEILHIRKHTVGDGLGIRELSSDRTGTENNEVLIARGVIYNETDQVRHIPNLLVSLRDKNDKFIQEKILKPPVDSLEAQSSIGFKVLFEQPDPSAEELSVFFTESQQVDEGDLSKTELTKPNNSMSGSMTEKAEGTK